MLTSVKKLVGLANTEGAAATGTKVCPSELTLTRAADGGENVAAGLPAVPVPPGLTSISPLLENTPISGPAPPAGTGADSRNVMLPPDPTITMWSSLNGGLNGVSAPNVVSPTGNPKAAAGLVNDVALPGW